MRIYTLTSLGKKLARSVSNPDSPAYRVVHFLDQMGHSTTEQIAEYCGISPRQAATILGSLKRRKVVAEVSGAPV